MTGVAPDSLPLDDIRVLDLTIARAGPTCVRQLADWGADVIRIDPPPGAAGELTDRHSSDNQNLHRNKRSLMLDLKAAEGRRIFFELVRRSDVLVENMRPPVKRRLGIDYEAVRAANRRIVYGSISGFGQDGPHAGRGGVDQIAQGMSGLMSVTGEPGRGPMRTGVAITDLSAGLYLAVGILVALHARSRTGEGQWVQTSLLEAGIATLDFQATRWTVDHVVPRQEGNHHPTVVPMGCFETADGYINIAAYGGRLLQAFAHATELPELVEDSRFATTESRSQNRAELNRIIGERLAQRTTSEWVDAFDRAGVPAGPVYTVDQAFADEQVRHLGLVQEVSHPTLGDLALIRNAVSMSGAPRDIRLPCPEPGEHDRQILTEAGLSPSEVHLREERGAGQGEEELS